MFSKSRRPVPSSAALKVLYQLAYISSGTAVGVAALCAEERRRRTHYVQKIADNAKRLRQSPRHVHNVAAAKQTEYAAEEDSTERGGVFWEEQSREDFSGRNNERNERSEGRERLVRAPELPSAVERGYAQVTRDHKRVRRRGPDQDMERQPGARWSRRGLDEDMERQTGARWSRPDARVSNVAVEHQSIHRPTFMERERRRIDPLTRPYGAPQPDPADRYQIRPSIMSAVVHPPPTFRSKEAANIVHPGLVHKTETNTLGNVLHDVGVFFHSVPWTSDKLRVEARVASYLLSQALQHGCLQQVRQLVSWKLANDKLDERDVKLLHEAYSTETLDDNDPIDVFELFAELFASKAFGKLPEDLRLSTAISFAADSLSWDIGLPGPSRAQRLLIPIFRASRHERIDNTMRELCDKRLTTNHQVRTAYSVLDAVRKATGGSTTAILNQRWKYVYELMLQQSKKRGQLWIWSHYIELLMRVEGNLEWVPKLEWLLQECHRLNAYTSLGKILHWLLKDGHWKVLSDQAKVNLALALATRKATTWEKLEDLFSAIPEALRGPVTEAICARRLHMAWKTKRSLPAVWTEYEHAKPFQPGRFGPAELTLIEICNKANQPDQALKLLSSSLQPESHSNLSLCIAAVSLARKSAWKQLRALVGIIASSGKFTHDEATNRNLNSVIDIYSHRHTAPETWKFVTEMVGAIGFVPNQITTDIMLQCFVSKQTLNLIPQWIRYLRTIGNDFQMNSRTATKLLKCFYFERRPPHVLLMWFSRNLTNKWPGFDSGELKDLILASIGYDLRKLPAQDKALLRQRAGHNLERLSGPNREMPMPYRPTLQAEHASKGSVQDVSIKGGEVIGDSFSFQPLGGQDSQEVEVKTSSQLQPSDKPGQRTTLEPDFLPDANPQISTVSFPTEGLVRNDFEDNKDFANLRAQYLATDHASSEAEYDPNMQNEPGEEPEYIHNAKRERGVLRDMILALSLQQYTKVLDLYHSSLPSTGLPISPLALEIATEASIRLQKGDSTEARDMLNAAQQAGMEVRRAIGPLLIHQIHSLDSAEKKDANKLRTMVIDYYRTNEENGFAVKHHVGITAANTLINNHRPEHGINVLNAIYHSEWAMERPLDIVPMTVYLKGYAALRSEFGISWVLRKVLMGNMAIDRPFIAALKEVCQSFGIAGVVRRTRMRVDRTGFISRLRAGRQECIERRAYQRFQTKKMGNLLVKRILEARQREMGTVDMDRREELEEAFFGKGEERFGDVPLEEEPHVADDTHEVPPAVTPTAFVETQEEKSEKEAPRNRLEARRAKARIAKAIRHQGEDRTNTRRMGHQTVNAEWLKQYRAFQRKDLIMADGKLASFRKYVP